MQCIFISPGECFAVVKMVHNLRKNVCRTAELTNPEDPVLRQLQLSDLLGSHFTAAGEETNCLRIACEDMLSRVVFFPLEDRDFNVKGYVSPVPKTYQHNRPFSYFENESGSNDISLNFVGFSNVHNCDRSSNATQSNLAYKIV